MKGPLKWAQLTTGKALAYFEFNLIKILLVLVERRWQIHSSVLSISIPESSGFSVSGWSPGDLTKKTETLGLEIAVLCITFIGKNFLERWKQTRFCCGAGELYSESLSSAVRNVCFGKERFVNQEAVPASTDASSWILKISQE